MAGIQYLTLQDVIWLNSRIMGAETAFQFMKLEEGVFYQYSYGSAQGVMAQAARFVSGLAKNQPFEDGNEATALAAALVFLAANGYEIVGDLPAGLMRSCASAESAEAALRSAVQESNTHGHSPSIEECGEAVLRRLGPTLAAMASSAA